MLKTIAEATTGAAMTTKEDILLQEEMKSSMINLYIGSRTRF